MPVSITVKIDMSRLQAVIARLPDGASFAAELGADAIESRAKQLAPVRTGALKNSIGKRNVGSWWYVVADIYYAIFVELGTRKMAARPYLVPAVDSVDWRSIVAAVLRRIGL